MSGVQRESGAVYPTSPRSPGQMRHRKRSHEVSNETNEPNGSHLLVNDQNKYASMKTRAWSTLWMLVVFCAIIYLGHVHIVVTVVIIQVFMVKEIFALARRAHEERDLPGFRILNWHFFVAAMIYVYGLILREQLLNTVFSDKYVNWLTSNFIKYHLLICYSLYITGFVWFILTLKKGMYKYQFSQFAWTHMILLVVLAQSSFTVANIFEGLFWFILPASLIIINDVAAYLWGFFFGRRPLIQLSPKKTWEGFIGASLTTILCAFMVASFLGRYQWLACPRKDLSIGWLYCDPDPLFKPKIYYLNMFPSSFPWKQITALPVQWHALWFGLFASSIAPFGGFFASGFKRAFKIKDFGDSIPGHGGITDRMDCQMGMAVFTYIYYNTFIKPNRNTVETILRQILENLTIDDQMNLYKQLGLILSGWQNVSASSIPL